MYTLKTLSDRLIAVFTWVESSCRGSEICALRYLSLLFGEDRRNCGICLYCCNHATTETAKLVAEKKMRLARQNKIDAEHLLRRLTSMCLVCKQKDCKGNPFDTTSYSCMEDNICTVCRVSNHKRFKCFKVGSVLKDMACHDRWVMKGIPGWVYHNGVSHQSDYGDWALGHSDY